MNKFIPLTDQEREDILKHRLIIKNGMETIGVTFVQALDFIGRVHAQSLEKEEQINTLLAKVLIKNDLDPEKTKFRFDPKTGTILVENQEQVPEQKPSQSESQESSAQG